MITASKVLRPGRDDFFIVSDLFEMDYKLLKFCPLSLYFSAIEDQHCLKSGLSILVDFFKAQKLVLRVCETSNG